MPDAPTPASHGLKRANWVALRTLRQRPKVVDTTADGDPVFEVRDVRLVLRSESNHFNRLVQCSKCGRDVAGSPVLHASDLERTSSPVICRDCVKVSAPVTGWRNEQRPRAPAPAPGPAAVGSAPAPTPRAASPPPQAPPPPVAVGRLDGDRLARVENQLQAIVTRLREVTEAAEHRQTDDTAVASVEVAVRDGVAQARAEMASASEAMAARMAAVEDQLRRGLNTLAQMVDAQRVEMTATAASVAEVRGEVGGVAESQGQAAAAQEELRRRLDEVAARPASAGLDPSDAEALRQWAGQVQVELTALVDTRQAELREALSNDLDAVRVELVSRHQQVEQGMSRLEAMVAELRSDMKASVEAAGRMGSSDQALAQDELAAAQGEVERRLSELTEREAATAEGLAALGASTHAGERRLLALEERVQEAVGRLSERIEAQRQGVLDAIQAAAPPAGTEERIERRLAEFQESVERRLEATGTALRNDLETSIDAALRIELETVAQAQKELAGAQAHLDRRLDDLARQGAETLAGLESLAESTAAGELGLRSLQERVQEAVARLSERLELQGNEVAEALRVRRELRGAEERIERRLAEAQATAARSLVPDRTGGSVLDSLDAQLRAADDRLAQLAEIQRVEFLIGPRPDRPY